MQIDTEHQETPSGEIRNSAPPAEIKKTSGTKRTPPKKSARKKQRMGIVYNAPVTLTFSLICIGVMLLQDKLQAVPPIFCAAGCQSSAAAFNWRDPVNYASLFLHVFGHTDWNQLTGNLAFILLLGPALEDRAGSGILVLMIAMTAFVTGVINACFIPSTIMGTSGTVFMMIILSSLTTLDKTKIPLTFLLLCAVFLTKELLTSSEAGIAVATTAAHMAGGLCGGIIGYLATGPGGKR